MLPSHVVVVVAAAAAVVVVVVVVVVVLLRFWPKRTSSCETCHGRLGSSVPSPSHECAEPRVVGNREPY